MRTNTAGAAAAEAADTRFTRPLTPSRTDGVGERFSTLDIDNSPVELLRFRDDLVATPGFVDALRERVALLSSVRHPALPRVVDVIREGDRLTLVAGVPPGRCLSQFLAAPLPAQARQAFVTRVVRGVLDALAVIEAAGPGVTHGALTLERVFVAKDGQVSVTEYALAPALEQLALWPEELWLQFGLLAPADDNGHALFDPRTSVMQLGAVALSMLLGRTISLQDFEHRLPALREEAMSLTGASASALTAPLRGWLQRALHLTSEGYESASDAKAGLRQLIEAAGPAAIAELEAAAFPPTATGSRRRSEPQEASDAPLAADTPVVTRTAATPRVRPPWSQYLPWVAIALGVIAAGEAIAIAQLLSRKPAVVNVEPAVTIESPRAGDTVIVDGKTVGATPLQLRVNAQMHAIRLVPAAPVEKSPAVTAPTPAAADAKAAAALEQAAARQRSGGIAFSSPIELKVLEGNRVLGSTADGPIVASAGTHQLDLVNTALGYRTRQTVTIRAGVIAPLTITPPMGRISINAQPWAQVLIDNTPVGETPLANVPAAIGEHEIVFRHPQLGERREKITVRADAPARVSTSFQRQ